ncbi:MAG TPA: Ada metal-binding domain-containing protein [Reyranella sp.]|nr:Ada metal-binding domain-containing protein [Reyranella sp.]
MARGVRHDRRYDGRFLSGVRTTRIYCRPVCPGPSSSARCRRRRSKHGRTLRPPSYCITGYMVICCR